MVNRQPSRAQEARELLNLAGPIIGAQLAFMGMGVADTLMAGRLGAQDLAAVAVGANIWMVAFVFFMGVCLAISPMVAQRLGARAAPEQIAAMLQRALVFGALFGLAWWLALSIVPALFIHELGLRPETAELALRYLRAAAWGGPAFCVGFVLRYAMEGLGSSRPVLITGLLGLVVNVIGDYLLMFGVGPFPDLGAEGCGYASAFAGLVMALSFAWQFAHRSDLRVFQPWRAWQAANEKVISEMLRLGLPIALIWLAEVGLFAGVGLLMAGFGDVPVAAHQIAINVAAVAFMVPMGLGLATTARVGRFAGAGDWRRVQLSGWLAVTMSMGFAACSALLMWLAPAWIVGLYTDDQRVLELGAHFLLWAAVFQLFDGTQATASGALRGLKDTRMPMFITMLAYWGIGLPLGAYAAFSMGVGPLGLWWGLLAGLLCASLGLNLRWWRATRRTPAVSISA